MQEREPENRTVSAAGPSRTRSRTSIGARRNPEAEAAILSAARALLIEKGYSGFSIDEVARRAGAGKPTIYRWWPTKADLFIAVYAADKAASIALPATGNLERDLIAYTHNLWRFWQETPSGRTFRALVAEAQASETALDALRTKFLPERTRHLRQIFASAAERGEIDASDIEVLLALYLGFNWLRLLTGRNDDEPGTIESMVRIIIGGAKAAAPHRSTEGTARSR
jgi:AcrR family transcriptional regulator